MPSARPRVAIDDARSEASTTNVRDRITLMAGALKGKKNVAKDASSTNYPTKATAASSHAITGAASTNNTAATEHQNPHVDWATLPPHTLHSYQSAYRLEMPSSYTQPHAELLYKSCEVALRAPSQVLARRKAHDLRQYRKRQAQQAPGSGRAQTNGISKTSKSTRRKDKNGNDKSSDNTSNHNEQDVPSISIEAPPSPTSHPSNIDSNSVTADNVSLARATPLSQQLQQETQKDVIPSTLSQKNPLQTIIGSIPQSTLATSIRKHFNAQQLNEAETIARFTYVVRQQGSNLGGRTQSLTQRLGTQPLPPTTAENIADTARLAAEAASFAHSQGPGGATGLGILVGAAGAPSLAVGQGAIISGTTGGNAGPKQIHSSLAVPRVLGGRALEVEGSYGDGNGWIMGPTSCGRQVRVADGGGGTFRLRFRP